MGGFSFEEGNNMDKSSMKIDVDVDNVLHMFTALEDIPDTMEKVLEETMKEGKKRAPAWVRAVVAEHYGIAKSRVKGKGEYTKSELILTYEGEMHTLKSFGMKPTRLKSKPYTVSAEILKGKRASFREVKKHSKEGRKKGVTRSKSSPVFMAYSKNAGQYLPFQRVSTDRNDLHVIKALSTAQTVSSKRTEPDIYKLISENLAERVEQQFWRYINNW